MLVIGRMEEVFFYNPYFKENVSEFSLRSDVYETIEYQGNNLLGVGEVVNNSSGVKGYVIEIISETKIKIRWEKS